MRIFLQTRPQSRLPFSAILLTTALVAASQLSAQFGGGKPSMGNFITAKHVDLSRKLPPIYDLHGKKIQVVMAPDTLAERTGIEVRSDLERLLTTGDSTVHVEIANPDVIINCEISNYEKPHEVTVGSGSSATQVAVGGLNVAFRIVETRSQHVIAASVASSGIVRNLPSQGSSNPLGGLFKKPEAPTYNPFEDQNQMVGEVARQTAAFMVITPEPVSAQLAVGGPLNDPNKLALSYLWPRYLESLETMKPLEDPRLDAYRIYDIGVANEALAYKATDPVAVQKYLHEASINYGKAVDARPDERGFLPAQNRILGALDHFKANTELLNAAATPTSTSTPGPVSGGASGGSTPSSPMPASGDIMTNGDVINLVHAGAPEDAIIDLVKNSPKVNFDISANGVIALSTGGVNANIQRAIRQRVQGVPVTPAPAPAPVTAPRKGK